MSKMKALVAGLASAGMLALAASAGATVVTAGSDALFQVDKTVSGQGKTADLAATFEFSQFQFAQHPGVHATTVVSFDVSVANKTLQGSLSNSVWQSIRLTSFGFNTSGTEKAVSDDSSVFKTTLGVNFPSFQQVDVCIYAGQNCSGGGNAGLHPGQSDSFTVALTVSGLLGSLDLGIGEDEIIASKFQTGFGSFEPGATPYTPPCIPGTPGCVVNPPALPEPTSFALLGMGLIGLAAMLRLRRRKTA